MVKKIVFFVISITCFLSELSAQCPMCKASVESNQSMGGKSVGMGLNTGILLLLSSVYIIVFTVGILWYRNYKRSLPTNA
ncbi:MAG: hypothetical protein PSX81_10560 [bacterium]|nr:hypothetical protein [bacterium]